VHDGDTEEVAGRQGDSDGGGVPSAGEGLAYRLLYTDDSVCCCTESLTILVWIGGKGSLPLPHCNLGRSQKCVRYSLVLRGLLS
jgi:hypothetical protein